MTSITEKNQAFRAAIAELLEEKPEGYGCTGDDIFGANYWRSRALERAYSGWLTECLDATWMYLFRCRKAGETPFTIEQVRALIALIYG